MTNYLKGCPQCHQPGQQRTPQSFVHCGNKSCSIYRLSIPLAAWQSWPRSAFNQKDNQYIKSLETEVKQLRDTLHQQPMQDKQRAEEVRRLQKRLAQFGAIEQQNQSLTKGATEAHDELYKARSQLKSKEEALYKARQRAEKITADRDIKQLELKKVLDWAIRGAQVSWAAGNDRDAHVYERLLELLGKRDATKVPCAVCRQLPDVHQYPDRPEELRCRCFKGSRDEWLRRQRLITEDQAKQVKTIATKTFDRESYVKNIAKARKEIPGVAANLVADLNELMLYLVEHAGIK